MTGKDCIKERRSIRKFKPQTVEHAILEELIETASYSPSWKHTQIVRYLAIEGELKAKIAAECTSQYPPNGVIIENAPVLIAVTFVKGRSGFERDGSFSTSKDDSWQMFDAGISSQSFCLAAHEKGLGTVILGIFDEHKASALLALSDTMEIAAFIPVGYPDEEPAAPRRKPVEDLLSYQSY